MNENLKDIREFIFHFRSDLLNPSKENDQVFMNADTELSVHYSVNSSYHILSVSPTFRSLLNIATPTKEDKCYKLLYNYISPCQFCPLVNIDSEPNEINFTIVESRAKLVACKVTSDTYFIRYHSLINNQVAQKRDLLEDIADNINEFFFVREKDSITYASPAYSRIFQQHLNDFYKNPAKFLEIVHPNDYEEVLIEYKTTYLSGNFMKTFRVVVDNVIKWINIKTIPLLDDKGEVVRIIGVGQDITDLKNNELELLEAKEKAEESDRLKSSFLANMSHEIRTPLNGIIGFSQLIATVELSPDKKERYSGLVELSANQLLNIVEDILDIAKIESGDLVLTYKKINVNNLLAELYAIFVNERRLKQKEHINLSLNVALTEDDAFFYTDPDRLRQIMYNLIGNALKFTENGSIVFGYIVKGNMLEFFVKDTGIGIKAAKQSIIFDRFRQEDESHTRKFGGTGLGLSICKNLIELLNGKIWLNSESGVGTTFNFTIPLDTGKNKVVDLNLENNKPYLPSLHLAGYSILIVDDVDEIHFFMSEILEDTKATIVSAKSGKEAIEIVDSLPIDLVLMDIQMPDMNGYEAAKIIRQKFPEIPIIAQTANALPSDRVRALNEGFNAFLTKPIGKLPLFIEIKSIFQNRLS